MVSIQDERIISISLGDYHSSALTSIGRLFTWGNNNYGQLGDGTHTNRYIPTEITSHFNLSIGETINRISLGAYHSSALTTASRLFTWGNNNYGKLGDGTDTNRLIPTEIENNLNLETGETIESISLGDYYSSVLTSIGRLFAWGYKGYGVATSYTYTPREITNNFNLSIGETVTSVTLGTFHFLVLTLTGRLFTWGNNDYGQLGDETNIFRYTPIEITSYIPTLINSEFYNYNETMTEYVPQSEGYTFSGWYIDPYLTTLYTFATMPSENMHLYGRWIPNH